MNFRYLLYFLGAIVVGVIAWQAYRLFVEVDKSVGQIGESLGKKDVSLTHVSWETIFIVVLLGLFAIFMKIITSRSR